MPGCHMHDPQLEYIHTGLKLEADVGDHIMTYWALVDDTLRADLLHPQKNAGGGVSASTAAGLCSVVTCEPKANSYFKGGVSEPRLTKSSAYMSETFQAGRGSYGVYNVSAPLRVTLQKICTRTMGSEIHGTFTESEGEHHFQQNVSTKSSAVLLVSDFFFLAWFAIFCWHVVLLTTSWVR